MLVLGWPSEYHTVTVEQAFRKTKSQVTNITPPQRFAGLVAQNGEVPI